MAVYSNLPTFTYIKWDNMMIAYNGQVYPIQNAYTNNKYVYFDSSNPYQLLCSNEKKTEIGGRFLVIINEKGIHTLVPHEDLVITFDGDNSDLIAEKIFGIYETNKEFGDKFISVETDIEGVKTTVGKVERENNEIKESVSLIDQKADKISQEVKKVEKAFNESQDNVDLRERLNKSIIDINTSLGIFKSYFGEIKTGALDTVTKTEINTHIDIVIKNKDAMILQVNKVEVLMEQGGFTDKLNALTSSKTAAINAIDNLITIIRTSISDNTYVPSEVTIIVDAFGKATTKINILKNSCDDCIFLGTGGSIVEELSRLEMKSDKIVLSVSKTEESLKNTLSVNKAQAQGQIQDLQTSISNFKQALETIFGDGLVSEIETGVINEHYAKLDKEKSDIESLYNTYVSDVNLSESQKNSLKTAYNDFVASHNNVKSKINEVIQDGFVNESEMAQVKSELLKYEDQSNQLLRNICHALDDIEINKNNKAVADAKKQLQQEIGEVNSKVGDLDNTINTTFKDNIIDEAERTSIKQNLNTLSSEKSDIDKQYEQLYKNIHLTGQLKVDFKTAYDSFVNKYNSLVSIIEGILNKPTLIEDNDRRNMDNAYEQMNTTLAGFTTVANKVIENVAKKEAETVKTQLDKDIEEVNNRIDGLDLSIDGTFVDNILDQAERKDIGDNLAILRREKIDVDNQYNQLILSPYLDGQLKVDYTNKYNEFTTKFAALEKVITDILEKVDLINDTDRFNMNSAHESLNTVLGDFVTLSNKVIEYIGKRQSDSSLEDLNGQLGDLNNKVDNIVGDVTEAVSDSVLDKSERQTLKESLNVLNAQKSQVDSQYTLVYNNANLTNSSIKNELKTTYDIFNQKYNLLINSIDSLLNKAGNITEIDRNNYANSYNEYKVAISNYTAKLQLANEEIFNKGIDNAKQELNNEISDVSDSLTNLSNTMEGVFKDGILSESEKIAIRQNLKTLETEKLDIDKSYDTLYSNSKLIGSAKVNLKSSYDNYIEKYNNLISVINGILGKVGIIDSIDQKNLNTAFDAHKVALGNFREKYNLALDSVTTKSVEDVKQGLAQDINQVSGAVNNLQNTMNGVFKDGILSDSEKLAIKQNLQSLLVEKSDIDKQYSSVYNNVDLLGTAKTNLKTAYDNYISKYNSLVNTINTIINKSGIVDSTDNNNLNTAFNNHSIALGTYSTRINEAIDSIAKKKSDDAYNNSKKFTQAEIKVVSDKIALKVEQTDINNAINNMEIGGRNLLLNSYKEVTNNDYMIYSYTPTELFEINEEYTISVCVTPAKNVTDIAPYVSGGFKNLAVIKTNGTEKQVITSTFTFKGYHEDRIPTSPTDHYAKVGVYRFPDDGTVTSNTTIHWIKIEKGNKPTDWTPAPEDTQEQLDAHTAQITTTNNKVASIETNLSSITSRVSSVEQTQVSTNGKVTSLETWKKDAEQKITSDAIVSTVTSSKTYKDNLTGKVSTNQIISSINQTAEAIKIQANKIDMTGDLDLQGQFKCWKNKSNKTGNYLYLNGAMMYGYNKTGGNYPVFASGLWTDENMGYVSVGYTRADVTDVNGCLYMSPQEGNQGGRLTFSRLKNSQPEHTTLYFQKDGAIDFYSGLRGLYENDDNYTYRFDAGTSVKALRCNRLRSQDIYPRGNNMFNIGFTNGGNFSNIWGNNICTNQSHLYLGTAQASGAWETYGALAINSATGYVFPAKYNGALGLGMSNNRFSGLYSVNPVNVSSDERLKTDIHYLDEPMPDEPVIISDRVERNIHITPKDMYDFIRDDLKLASYRYNVNLEKGNTSVDYGFVAQDILYTKVGSEIVQLADKNDLNSELSYNQGNYISVIAGALQEEIKKRDEENKELKNEIEILKAQVSKLLSVNINNK